MDDSLLDNVPVLQSWASVVQLNTEFTDNKSFRTIFDTDLENELIDLDLMENLRKEGKQLVVHLYALRGCARSLPIVSDPNQPDKLDLYKRTFEVLAPRIKYISQMVNYQERALSSIGQTIIRLGSPERRRLVVPDDISTGLITLMDLLLQLDMLKDTKSSLMNDFSFYKRAFSCAKAEIQTEEDVPAQIQELQLFLSNPQHPKGLLFHRLLTMVQGTVGFDQVLMDLIKHSTNTIEEEHYVFPGEKFKLIRALPYLVIMLDKEEPGKPNANPIKKVKMDAIFKIFRANPVIPVFPDMSMQPSQILAKSSFFATLKGQKPKAMHSPILVWHQMRMEATKYMPHLARAVTTAREVSTDHDTVELQHAKVACDVIVQGVKLISKWKSTILQQLAWKYQYSAPYELLESRNVKMDTPTIEYERVLKHNYSKEELSALVDMISMVKSLANTLRNAEAKVSPFIRLNIHAEVQEFCQHTLLPLLHRVDKKHKSVKAVMLQLRSIGADWTDGDEPVDDYKARKDKRQFSKISHRYVGACQSQWAILRASTHALYDDRSTGMKGTGMFNKKDFDSYEVEELRNFYIRSYFHPHLLNLHDTVENLSNLADLWYREYYLELTKCIQFPIEMSLPWMLTEHVIQNPGSLSANLIESIVHVLDVYNDLASSCLRKYKQRFLYDEVEAEVNLCFDQLVFLISDQIYGYYKDLASSLLLDKSFKNRYELLRGGHIKNRLETKRYEDLMAQRHVQVLGRHVDLNALITHHIGNKFKKDLETALQRLEASQDISAVLEYKHISEVIKMTQNFLAEHLNIENYCDAYDMVNESTSIHTKSCGRVSTYIMNKILQDLIPNFRFDQATKRYTRSPMCVGKTPVKESMPKNLPEYLLFGAKYRHAFDLVVRLTKHFFGAQHLKAIVELLSPKEIGQLIEKLLEIMDTRIESILAVCIEPISRAIPPCKLPNFMYRVEGCFAYFESKFKQLIEYEERPAVFHCIREVGNILCFIHLLQEVLDLSNMWISNLANCYITTKDQDVTVFSVLSEAADTINDSDLAEYSSFLKDAAQQAKSTYTFHQTKLLSLALQRMHQKLYDLQLHERWAAHTPPMEQISNSTPFYQVWSTLQYIFTIPSNVDNSKNDEISPATQFGDGFLWTGMAIIHLLQQHPNFDLFDYSCHILNVAEFQEGTDRSHVPSSKRLHHPAQVGNMDAVSSEKALQFTSQAKRFQSTNSIICMYLNTHFVHPEAESVPVHFSPNNVHTAAEVRDHLPRPKNETLQSIF